MMHRPLAILGLVALLAGCRVKPEEKIGADVPWTRYEAEDARSNVKASDATRTYLTPESEAAGHRLVKLARVGDYVDLTVARPANGLVLRYSIPDSADGKGQDATLGLSINGKPQPSLRLTSKLSWVYGDFPWTNDSRAGRAHCFFDECQALIPRVASGDVIRLQVDASDLAGHYLIDFVELEIVEPPLARPENALSVAEFGATPDDASDDSAAFLRCIDAAKRQGKIVWVPRGVFVLDGRPKPLGGVEICGAGMWYARLVGAAPMFFGTGERLKVSDVAIFGLVGRRNDAVPDNAFNGNLGDGSEIARVWIEHMKCGIWTAHGTRNLRVTGCRIRNTMADGVNLCDGTTDSVIEQCHLRNTGDDALASWSPTGDWSSKKPCERNRFIRNTIESPWHANALAFYGGKDHQAVGNLVIGTVTSGGGLLISSGHGATAFEGTILVENNRFIRTGGDCYIGERNGGLWFHAKDSDIGAAIVVRNLALLDSDSAGITVHGPRSLLNATFENILIKGSGERGLHIMPSAGKVNLNIQGLTLVRTQ